MAQSVVVEVEVPAGLRRFRLPRALDQRLQRLLDRQDRGEKLSPAERKEATGLVELAEFLSFLKLRAKRVSRQASGHR
jgi:hypothetical protein